MEGEEKKKSSIGLIILVVILVIGSLVGGYFMGTKGLIGANKKTDNEVNDKSTNKDKEKEPVVTEYEVKDEKVVNLIPSLVSGGFSCGVIEEYISDGKVTASDITNVRAFIIAQGSFIKAGKTEITLDDYTKEIQKHLGKDYNFNPDTIDYNSFYCPMYKYDSTNKKFVKQETACGGECGPYTRYKVVKAVDTDGTLVLDVKVVFTKAYSSDYYADYSRTKSLGNFETVNLDSILDSGTNYKFTFKLEDDNYVFVSSELVN